MEKVVWGILGAAKIGIEKVIPAMQKGKYSEIKAIASRSIDKAQEAAKITSVPVAYGSYDELLKDDEINAIYIPLPNHLHVDWTMRCVKAGKHVLCEKPLALNSAEAKKLIDFLKDYPDIKVMEAFMYRHHPQWTKIQELVESGIIGELKTINSFFSYYNVNSENIRNKPEIGGGGLMDIGCYCISIARFLFDKEPNRVCGIVDFDPEMKIDRMASGLMDFGNGTTSTFTCSTQLDYYQRAHIHGTKGKIEVELPFNPQSDVPAKIWLKNGDDIQEISFDVVDQYTIQGDLFSQAILQNKKVPTPIEDGLANMKVIDAIFNSASISEWVNI